MSSLALVRHGQASLFADDYDILSPLGEAQARHLGDHWARRGEVFDEVKRTMAKNGSIAA